MKILVLFTGGTIGSTESSGYISLGEGSDVQLLSLFREQEKKHSLGTELIPITAMQVLSENSDGEFLNRLAAHVRNALGEAEKQRAAGLVVAHGTDTLAYSAAMLAYVFADSPLPVVLVSSNYILADPRANGLDNFMHAVDFIAGNPRGGVYVSYRNTGEEPRIHWGARLLGHQAYSDAVYSVEQNYSTEEEDWLPVEKLPLDAKFQAEAPILQIFPSPGMSYPVIGDEVQAILHHSYHAGTICSHGAGLERFLAEAHRRQIPVFLTGADSDMLYESMQVYEKNQIHVLPPASPVSMYMKLWLLLVNDFNPIEWMGKNIAGECRNG